MALFSKKNNKEKEEKNQSVKETEAAATTSFNPVQQSVVEGFYVSEKAGLLNGFNQYVFRVSDKANKSQLSKQIEKMFNVKVKSIKMLNTQKKRRDIGRYPGFKPGFKKAIVVLQKGHSIEQAKA